MTHDHEKKVPSDYHTLYDAGARRLRGAPMAAAAAAPSGAERRLAEAVPTLAVEYDAATQRPNLLASRRPGAALSAPAADAAQAVQRFIAERRDLWGLSDADAATVDVVSVSRARAADGAADPARRRSRGLQLGGHRRGGPSNEVISVVRAALPGRGSAAPARSRGGGPADAARGGDRQGGLRPDRPLPTRRRRLRARRRRRPTAGRTGFYQHQARRRTTRARAFDRPVRVKDVMFPLGERAVRPRLLPGAVDRRASPPSATSSTRSTTPDVLFRKNLTAQRGVHATACTTPATPCSGPTTGRRPAPRTRPGCPTASRRRPIAEKLVDDREPAVPGDPWLPADATTTDGQQLHRLCRPAAPRRASARGDVARTGHRARHVRLHLRPQPSRASDPTNLQNSLVGMFFHVNWLHDRWYEAGFDEAAGNAQQDNFGRGGVGGDPILAEGNDFSGTDNANMATPADGASPRMQMFEFTRPEPAAQPHQQPRGPDHLPRDGPLHHQPAGRQRRRA